MAFDITNAVQLYAEMKSQTVNLWVWFAAGNFAAVAGYFSAGRMKNHVKLAFLAGFAAYAAGNLVLIVQNLGVLNEVIAAIAREAESANVPAQYQKAMSAIAGTDNPIYVALSFHLVVDVLIGWIVWHHDEPVDQAQAVPR